jgi:AraC family transcriptional regulator
MPFHTSALHRGAHFSIHDVDCHSPASACGPEEQASSHHLVFVRRGVFVKHIGRRQLVADASRALFFNGGEPYRVSHPIDGGDACTMITCSTETWTELLSRHDVRAADRPHAPFAQSHVSVPWRATAGYHRLRAAVRGGAVEPLELEEAALAVIDDVLCTAHSDSRTEKPSRRRATRAARRDLAEHTALVLASHPGARHSLSGLARSVSSSPFHLARVFREETGASIHQHLLKIRLALSLEQVLERSQTLSEIAYSLGFSSHAHFSALFRRRYGASPSDLSGRWAVAGRSLGGR